MGEKPVNIETVKHEKGVGTNEFVESEREWDRNI